MTQKGTPAWIQTFSNIRFDLLNPTPEMVCIEDLAHHLANLCRFTGATKFHYSVAQHSYYCSFVASPKFAFEALLHDASEAYYNDMSRPLKYLTDIGKAYRPLERIAQNMIQAKYGITAGKSPQVDSVDNAMLYAEKAQLMKAHDWRSNWEGEPANILIQEWTPRQAEAAWTRRFYELADSRMLMEIGEFDRRGILR